MFLPYLSPAGERAPFLDPHARGSLWGLDLQHQPADVARAVFEGLSLVIRDCLTASGAATDELRVCGGGAASDAWCQLIADVTGVRTIRSADSEVGAKGAFLTGLVSLGHEPDLTTAAARYVRIRAANDPDPDRVKFYTTQYDRFLALRELSGQGWRLLADSSPGPDVPRTPTAEGGHRG